ncbi:formylglycine-generating enzyme family protein [Treponema denticola]|uniref:formylglycine-generating enzyme family protein n=1 Tax=Treponema denticola TaxID=158 RepID=UPI0020A31E1E|nr:SUMF1/EgtB/PvdO family nonheme iron enzyme [Treponema denticola]UTC92988.1 formylglycine-generating enzyme family protein [Treponema denticola]UTC98041.1 formylglycine-generating enzyme family protein [Treponema denticola]
MKHITKLILLAVLLVASCKNPVGNTTPTQITITVAGDEHVVLKAKKTFTTNKGNTWHQLKAEAESKIDRYEENYKFDKWTLTKADGQNLTNKHTFNENTTVFIVTKQTTTPPKPMITITVAGDEHVILKPEHTFEVGKGKTWNDLKTEAKKKIQGYKDSNYKLKEWRLANDSGALLNDSYTDTFDNDTTVFVVSEPIMITLTITGDHVDIDPPASITVQKGTKWGDVKDRAKGLLRYHPNYEFKQWRRNNQSGSVLSVDNLPLGNNMTIYAEARPTHVIITIKSDGHVQLAADPTIIKPYGVTWGAIKDEAKTKITCNSGYVFAAWKKGSTSGKELFDIDEFEEDTDVYATTQQVPISSGIKVTPPTGGIIGHAVSYTLPDTDASWKGVFIDGRTVNLNPYKIGKHEVTVQLWKTVYKWAKDHGYLFDFDPDNEDTPTKDDQPMANISWTDCIAWCNAYTEMWFGTTNECVYRKDSASGEVIKHAFHGDKAYCDFSKKGFRLPTEAEWEYAARYQGTDNTNAESYGTVYLTNVNSASGATKPIGFEGMSGSPNFADLRDETARVAVFNQWWNGMAFVTQTPPVNDRANVGSKPANKLGLHDMSGNVAEWCWDLYTPTVTASTNAYPTGPFPDYDTKRVVRGGNWSESTGQAVYDCMTGKRKWNYSGQADPIRGFRLVWNE